MEKSFAVTDETMDKINKLTVNPLKKEDVYCFSVLLCDNDTDRDYENFSIESLEKLSELFVGRTGIFNHDAKTENQSARIFQCEVKHFKDRKTAYGEEYCALMGYAYMVKTENNKSLIAEIDGGIKKEVSVSCSVERKICSICGADASKNACSHIKGKHYHNKLCFFTLENPTDAYEWSFVAVPAQRNAGVVKKYSFDNISEKSLFQDEIKFAVEDLKRDILRLSYFTQPYISAKSCKEQLEGMNIMELIDIKGKLRQQVAQLPSNDLTFIGESMDDSNSYKI